MRIVVLILTACVFAYGNVPLSENSPLGHQSSAPLTYQGIGQANSFNASGLRPCVCDESRRSRSTSKERDAETGLDYFGARYFSGAQGRFTSPDAPFAGQDRNNPQSWNLYSYGLNNPLRFIDPSGHDPEEAGCGANLKDCGPTIGPLPQTTSHGQTQDRVIGAVKGTASEILDLAGAMGAPSSNVDQIKDFFGLYPSSQNQQFGGQIAGILGAVIPVGGATKEARVAAKTFEEARNAALGVMGELGEAARTPNVGRVGALKGEITGFRTTVDDVFKSFRLDFDATKGAHINVTVGKAKYSFEFPSSLEQVKALLQRNVQK